jgi:hypothetical protein
LGLSQANHQEVKKMGIYNLPKVKQARKHSARSMAQIKSNVGIKVTVKKKRGRKKIATLKAPRTTSLI